MFAALRRFGRSLSWALITGKDADLAPPARWWWRGPTRVKILLVVAGFVVAATSYSAWISYLRGDTYLVLLLLILQSAPLPLSGRFPLTALRVAGAGMLLAQLVTAQGMPGPLAGWPLQTQFLPYLPLLAMVLARTRGADGMGISALAVLLAIVTGLTQQPSAGSQALVWALIVVTATIAIGYGMQQRRRALATGEVAEEERGKRTALEERTRIARELHDIIGHHLTLIALRADSAPYRVADVSETAAAELRALGEAAREALDETRRLVGVLREDDAAPERTPQPGAADLPRLIEQCRESGLDVRSRIDAGVLPATVGLAVYRILQEALSNARRHSPGAAVEVEITRSRDEVAIVVENGPPARTPPPGRGDGTGLAGIAERASLLGGSSEAVPRPDGGFRLAVTLVITVEEAAAR